MSGEKYQNCTEEERKKNSKPCAFNLTTLGECYSPDNDFKYGYDDGKPCIFFKMNKVSLSLLQKILLHRNVMSFYL